jgi:hypothetical protein
MTTLAQQLAEQARRINEERNVIKKFSEVVHHRIIYLIKENKCHWDSDFVNVHIACDIEVESKFLSIDVPVCEFIVDVYNEIKKLFDNDGFILIDCMFDNPSLKAVNLKVR